VSTNNEHDPNKEWRGGKCTCSSCVAERVRQFWTTLASFTQNDDGVDYLFDQVNDAILDGDLAFPDQVLVTADVSKLRVLYLLCLLNATHPASKHLKNREAFVKAVTDRLFREDPTRAPKLLWGLI